ncbi:hypothetical protein AB0C70_42670 [Streptomyces sp. NPDC048564]|uniref:hypothetical protein n=1 Tax=Streptomyces sp. NPDC048564 TaxID=3155760 RepID=UPI00343B01FC
MSASLAGSLDGGQAAVSFAAHGLDAGNASGMMGLGAVRAIMCLPRAWVVVVSMGRGDLTDAE